MEQNVLGTKTSLGKAELIDKIKGVIYGAAIGDGVGLATEFMSKNQAQILFGNGPIKFGRGKGHEFWRDAHRGRWHESDFTDDTDQMLLILQSLLADNGTLNPLNFAYRIDEWRRIGFPELDNKLPNGIGFTVGSTFSHESFSTDPFRAAYDVWNANHRDLAPNGAVMRTGVMGVPHFWDEGKVAENSVLAAKVTHADPRSVASAVIVSVIISKLLGGSLKSNSSPSSSPSDDNEKHLTTVMEWGSTPDRSYLELDNFTSTEKPPPKHITRPISRTVIHGIRRFFALISRQPLIRFQPDLDDFNLPEYPPVDLSRFHRPADIRPDIPSMDDFGEDPEMMALCKDVVSTYSFLVESNSLCDKKAGENAISRVDELQQHCFPSSLSALKLDEGKKIGYTLKCLGAGLYSVTRRKPEEMSSSKFYQHIITELTLQCGDADTNCAVAGALLGCRLGKSGLPKSWVDGLRNKAFVESLSNQLCDMVLETIRREDGVAK